jgi:hypothetical protein
MRIKADVECKVLIERNMSRLVNEFDSDRPEGVILNHEEDVLESYLFDLPQHDERFSSK